MYNQRVTGNQEVACHQTVYQVLCMGGQPSQRRSPQMLVAAVRRASRRRSSFERMKHLEFLQELLGQAAPFWVALVAAGKQEHERACGKTEHAQPAPHAFT